MIMIFTTSVLCKQNLNVKVTSLQANAKFLIMMISALGRWKLERSAIVIEPISNTQMRNSVICSCCNIRDMSCRLTRELQLQF